MSWLCWGPDGKHGGMFLRFCMSDRLIKYEFIRQILNTGCDLLSSKDKDSPKRNSSRPKRLRVPLRERMSLLQPPMQRNRPFLESGSNQEPMLFRFRELTGSINVGSSMKKLLHAPQLSS